MYRQCFLNIVDLEEVAHFLLLSLVCGPDYIVYFTVAVLRQLEPDILQAAQMEDGGNPSLHFKSQYA